MKNLISFMFVLTVALSYSEKSHSDFFKELKKDAEKATESINKPVGKIITKSPIEDKGINPCVINPSLCKGL